MLFLTYWELNESLSSKERLNVAKNLAESGLFPPKGVKIIRWDTSPDGWGILLLEAETASDVGRTLNAWRTAVPGFFKFTKTSPAMPLQDAIAAGQELQQSIDALNLAKVSAN